MAVRLTQEFVQTLLSPSSRNTRLTQAFAQTLLRPSSRNTRLTQAFTQTLFSPASRNTRLTQIFVQVLLIPSVTITVSDSYTLSDNANIFLDNLSGIFQSSSDTLSQFLDGLTLQSEGLFQTTDIYFLNDNFKFNIGLANRVSDQLQLTDNSIYELGAAREAYDTFQYFWNDSTTLQVIDVIFLSETDSLSLGDSVNTFLDTVFKFRSVSDSINFFQDTVSFKFTVNRSTADSLNLLSDFLRVFYNTLEQNSDSLSVLDNLDLTLSGEFSTFDSLTSFQDNAQIQLNAISASIPSTILSDQLVLTDSVVVRQRENLLPYLRRYLNDV
jgi:hypothetical protein